MGLFRRSDKHVCLPMSAWGDMCNSLSDRAHGNNDAAYVLAEVIPRVKVRRNIARVPESDYVAVQEALSNKQILIGTKTNEDSAKLWRGNEYHERREAVQQLGYRWRNQSVLGNATIQRAIKIQASLALPSGVDVVADDPEDAAPELDYIKECIDYNNLNEGGALSLAVEQYIEGSDAEELVWNEAERLPKMHHIPWLKTQYAVARNDVDPDLPGDLTSTHTSLNVPADRLGYFVQGSRRQDFNGFPTTAGGLGYAIAIDQTVRDWHLSTSMFGNASLVFSTNDSREAEKLRTWITSNGWQPGNVIAINGTPILVEPSGNAAEAAKQELEALIKLFCNATSLMPQWVGWADILSNRAVADEMGQVTNITNTAELSKWRGEFETLFNKWIMMRNEKINGQLRVGVVRPKLLQVTDRAWEVVEKVWLPLAKIKPDIVMSHFFWDNIPEIDRAKVQAFITGGELDGIPMPDGPGDDFDEEAVSEAVERALALRGESGS